MRTLILSDIHANWHALQAVLEDAGDFDRLVFLGDLVNFGPHPAQCLELLRQYDPICIAGNHDAQILSEKPEHFWDAWAREQLSANQLQWLGKAVSSMVLDGHILLLHGSPLTKEDLLPNALDEDIAAAFRGLLNNEIDEVWFGHYHYELDRTIDGVTYRCIRPVGQHRDGDVKTGYSIYEDGKMEHRRLPYPLEKTVDAFKKLTFFTEERASTRQQFIELLLHAKQDELLHKDVAQWKKNEAKRAAKASS